MSRPITVPATMEEACNGSEQAHLDMEPDISIDE
jgi:hypothetical protein